MAIDEKELWRTYAKYYPRLYELLPLQAMFREVIEAAQLNDEVSVLDVGCGTGFWLRAVQQYATVRPPVVGIDGSREMIYQAMKEPYDGETEFCLADLNGSRESWGLQDRQFSRIISVNSLYALTDPALALHKLYDLALPGAVLVVSVPRSDPDMGALLAEHLRLTEANGGDPIAEQSRILELLAPIIEINKKRILPFFHLATRQQVHSWFVGSNWRVNSISTTYADQDWLVVAERR